MCIGIPGRITALPPGSDLAEVDVGGVVRAINVGLLGEDRPAPGDWILIHSGFALSRMTEQEARDAMDFLVEVSRAFDRQPGAASATPPVPAE